jgi:hypothetical protein
LRQAIKQRIEAKEIGNAGLVHGFPDLAELSARSFPASFGKARRKRDRVHRACARARNPADGDVFFLEQPIEDAPRESTMGAATLERQVQLHAALE